MKITTSLPLHIKWRPRKPPGTGGAPAVPNAPILTWTSASTVSPPTFNLDFTGAAVSDVVTIRRSTDIGFATYEDATDTIDSLAPINALAFDFTPTTWADATYYVKAFVTRGASVGPDSNTETVTIAASSMTDYIELEDATGYIETEDGLGYIQQEAA